MSKLISCHSDPNTASLAPRTDVTVYFAESLIAEFLCRLPVKILLRCRCVSKLWCSLIDSPSFVKKHLKRSIECRMGTGVIIRECISYSVDFDSLDNGSAIEIDEPLKTLLCETGSVGTCNGLLCVFNMMGDMFLWNPATKKCRKLPTAPADFRSVFNFSWSSLSGFGFDVVNDDYKVLRILRPDDPFLSGSKVVVYSLKTNSWKRLQDIPVQYQLNASWGNYLGGALHWIMVKTRDVESFFPSILAFDLGVENCREIPMPHKNGKEMSLVIFEESLCVLEFHLDIHVDVWVMTDYGVENSWCKLFSVEQPKVSESCMTFKPLAYSKSQRDVLVQVNTEKLIWYNLEKKEVRTVKIANIPDVFDVEVFTESLVSLDYNSSTDGKQAQKQPKQKNKQQKMKERDNYLSKGFKLVL
ncbi:F-box protein CPR1-like [Daucus carota subsp. sativus]|nr:PREDICTED: F-box protein CPR30-like isoform X3 [Daucus carota subsp. sativus]XP_017255807.1 PREDICTED: F-box protein CPR30-like isoform X3 [Daucus carota subsp. sativus]XP_017255808.1 PREDICTED: F-box protein CPR30-like isoform X3 [Daucus carota subsp. sativus]